MLAYVQQAAAAKTIGILVKLSVQIAEQFLSVIIILNSITVEPLYSNTWTSHQKCSEITRFSKNRVSILC